MTLQSIYDWTRDLVCSINDNSLDKVDQAEVQINNKTFDTITTKLLPDLNADPRSNTQNLKPKNPNLRSFDTRTTKLLPHLNGDPRSKT